MRLTMVGTGYVGLVTGACLAESGNDVCCLDIDPAKIKMLQQGHAPIYEPGLAEMLTHNIESGRLKFTTDADDAYSHAQVIFICVGTPTDAKGGSDLSAVFTVAREIGAAIDQRSESDDPILIVVKSTVPVGTTHQVQEIIRSCTKRPFLIANNPEFLKEGDAISDFSKPDRVVCGIEQPRTASLLEHIYQPFVRQGHPIIMMDILSSEMVKYASNAMLACKISFINEMAHLCELYGADISNVRQGMCSDHRIGNQFFYPGLGYGGSCFPKDTLAVMRMGEKKNWHCQLNTAVHEVNQAQRQRFWNRIESVMGSDLKGKKIAFWGISFKPQTDDIRESPAINLIQQAIKAGATVMAYDPVAGPNLEAQLPEVAQAKDLYAAAEGAHAVVVSTEWNEFRTPDLNRVRMAMAEPLLFDGRNIFDPQQMQASGFKYHSIGRASTG